MSVTSTDSRVLPWWGKYTLGEGETACWRIGPLQVWARRTPNEWHLAYRKEQGPDSVEVNLPCPTGIPADTEAEHRYIFREPGNSVVLQPFVPDRPLVWRPNKPLTIAPGEETTLYFRTSLWLTVRVEGCDGVLWEVPLRRLSDTWIGAPTETGGYAYSAEREVFLSNGQAPVDATHATTPLTIRNSAKSLLHLERLTLPVPFLSLFSGVRGGLWTQEVKLERQQENHEVALVHIGKGAPHHAEGAEWVAGPREDAERNVVFEAFKRFFL